MSAQSFKPGQNSISFFSEGETLVGHLYLPRDYKEGDRLPAVIIGGSWTTVKEQMAGLYAQKLADYGYATMAFDHRFYGESGGEPRFLEDPKEKTKDFINASAYLKSLELVNDQVGGVAVCASGGYMADAIGQSDGFQSFAMVVPWFNTDEIVNAFYGGEEGINDRIDKSRAAEERFRKEGVMNYIASISDTDPSAAMFGPFDYYLNEELGRVPNWSDDKFALASWEPWLTYRPVAFASRVDVPTLMITSEGAATPAADRQFFDQLAGEKELVWLEGGQLDFYYQPELVEKSTKLIAQHFEQSLK